VVSRNGACHELVGEWVKITGRTGVYVVLGTNAACETADVLLVSGIRQIERGVPVGMLHPLHAHQRAEQWRAADLEAVGE
jgi:hypothetical protein